MDKLIIATNNQGKVKEIKAILGGIIKEALSLSDAGVTLSPEENGSSFEENALIKARAALGATGLPSLADDSGICALALGGAPGIYSARFSGHDADDQKNNEKLARLLGKVPESERGVWYECAIALCLPGGREYTASGRCEGVFILSPRGSGGFGYDPYFYLPGLNKTMAELDPEVKNKLSHRFRALCAMQKLMTELEL